MYLSHLLSPKWTFYSPLSPRLLIMFLCQYKKTIPNFTWPTQVQIWVSFFAPLFLSHPIKMGKFSWYLFKTVSRIKTLLTISTAQTRFLRLLLKVSNSFILQFCCCSPLNGHSNHVKSICLILLISVQNNQIAPVAN